MKSWPTSVAVCSILFALSLALGCSRRESDAGVTPARNPSQAASQLEHAFSSAAPDTKEAAQLAAEALRKNEFEKAIVSLQTIRSSDNVTVDQGIAVNDCSVLMEERLIRAMESGDENAKRAYSLLKEMKRR